MQEARNTLLSLVRSALWQKPAENLPSSIDWEKVVRLARQQTLLGLLADSVQMLPEQQKPDGTVMRNLQVFMMRNIQSHMLITSKLAQTVDVLRKSSIEPVLFKGHGLAMNYPDPMSRQCGDIDLYVGKSAYEKAIEVCIEHFGPGEHDSESSKHYHFDYQGVSVELHRIAETLPGFIADSCYQKWTVENLTGNDLRHVDIEGVQVNLPPYQFDPIYVLNHAWHHFCTGGIGLRQLCDWTVYLHNFHDKLDITRLEADLKSFELLKVWHMFAWISVNHLGLPAQECPLYDGRYADTAAKVLDIIWNEGNFGRHAEKTSKRPEGYSAGKIHSFINISKRYLRIIGIYPSQMIKAWVRYVSTGVYRYFKGLFE